MSGMQSRRESVILHALPSDVAWSFVNAQYHYCKSPLFSEFSLDYGISVWLDSYCVVHVFAVEWLYIIVA